MSASQSAGGLTEAAVETLGAILERLIPSGPDGPGACEAQVRRYILRALDTDYSRDLERYRQGLAATDAYAETRYGSGFAALEPEQQDDLLRDIEEGRAPGYVPSSGAFFELVRAHALEGMFGDPRWGGNANLVGWQLLGYQGPKKIWTEEEQQIKAW